MNINKHPIVKQAYELCLVIEDLGSGEKFTLASTKASELGTAVEALVDDNMTLEYQTAEAVTHVEEAIRQKTEDLTSENKKLRAQLKYIKSQVAPHFVERIEAING